MACVDNIRNVFESLIIKLETSFVINPIVLFCLLLMYLTQNTQSLAENNVMKIGRRHQFLTITSHINLRALELS